jgi:hypothetical protein
MTRAAVLLVALLGACSPGLGERCSADEPCPQGLVCTFPPAATSGVCDYAVHGLGESCTRAAECESALTCSTHFQPGSRYGTCVPRAAAGAPCFMGRDCQSGTCDGSSGSAADGVCR